MQVDPLGWKQLDSTLDDIGATGLTNYVMAVRLRGGQVYARSGGNLNLDSPVWIASASKALSCAAILTLVDEGRLDLDGPIASYLAPVVEWPADKGAITVRMLLNHTSGLCPHPNEWEPEKCCLRDFVCEIARSTPFAAPGEAYFYCGVGYHVAALIAEQISGLEWCDFVANRISQPLGVTTLGFFRTPNPIVAAGAVSNAHDYLKFTSLFLDEGCVGDRRILSPGSVAAMTSQNQVGHARDFWHTAMHQRWRGYSFGWWHVDPTMHPETPGPELSAIGIFGTLPWMDLEKRYAAVVITADGAPASLAAWPRLRRGVLETIQAMRC